MYEETDEIFQAHRKYKLEKSKEYKADPEAAVAACPKRDEGLNFFNVVRRQSSKTGTGAAAGGKPVGTTDKEKKKKKPGNAAGSVDDLDAAPTMESSVGDLVKIIAKAIDAKAQLVKKDAAGLTEHIKQCKEIQKVMIEAGVLDEADKMEDLKRSTTQWRTPPQAK